MQQCKACDLHKNIINQVQCTGNLQGKILWLLDAPTKEEDITGKAGAGIISIIESICNSTGVDFQSSLFQNIVLCRAATKQAGLSVETLPEQFLTCINNVLSVINAYHVEIVFLCGKNVDKYYKSRISIPHLTIVNPIVIREAGGFTSNIYIDTINKIRKWKYENGIE